MLILLSMPWILNEFNKLVLEQVHLMIISVLTSLLPTFTTTVWNTVIETVIPEPCTAVGHSQWGLLDMIIK